MIHQIGTRAERKVDAQLMQDFKRVSSKDNILYRIHKEALRKAIAAVVNAVFQVRYSYIWGEGTTTCASDSKKFDIVPKLFTTSIVICNSIRVSLVFIPRPIPL